jgi:hypothetical protein
MAWTGSIWLRIWTNGGLLWTRWWTFRLLKMLGSSWVATQLAASQVGLSSVSELRFWTLSIVLFLSKTRFCFCLKHNVSETGFCLRLQLEATQFGPIDRASSSPETGKCLPVCPEDKSCLPSAWFPYLPYCFHCKQSEVRSWLWFDGDVSRRDNQTCYCQEAEL